MAELITIAMPFVFIFILVLTILTILLPFIVLSIRNQIIKTNKKLEEIDNHLIIFHNNFLKVNKY